MEEYIVYIKILKRDRPEMWPDALSKCPTRLNVKCENK